MANRIIETDFRPQPNFVSPDSRYVDSSIIYYGKQNILTFKTYKRSETPVRNDDRFGVVEPGQEYRPDIISNMVYGVPDFWWRIMEANNIHDIFDFKAGLNIRLPGGIFNS